MKTLETSDRTDVSPSIGRTTVSNTSEPFYMRYGTVRKTDRLRAGQRLGMRGRKNV